MERTIAFYRSPRSNNLHAWYSVRWGTPNRVNYNTRFPVAKGVRDCFPNDVVRTIHIGIDQPAIRSAEQAARDALAGIPCVMLDWLVIDEAALAGVAFVDQEHLNPHQFGLVAQHLDKAGVWHLNEVLIVPLPNADLLLPAVVLADNQRSDALPYQQVDNPPAVGVQVVVNLARSFCGQPFHPLCASRLPKFGLQFGAALVVALVDVLCWATVNQNGHEARL